VPRPKIERVPNQKFNETQGERTFKMPEPEPHISTDRVSLIRVTQEKFQQITIDSDPSEFYLEVSEHDGV
jgi:hypothetical protein